MKQPLLRVTLRADENRQIHINVPTDMGEEFDVIVLPVRHPIDSKELGDEDLFMLMAYSAVTPDDPEEDAIWEKYIHA